MIVVRYERDELIKDKELLEEVKPNERVITKRLSRAEE